MTRSELESRLIARYSAYMTLVGLDGTTEDGTNADLTEPISQALLELDESSISACTDAELVAATSIELLSNIRGNLTLVRLKVGPRSEDYNQLHKTLNQMLTQAQNHYYDVLSAGYTGNTNMHISDQED